MTLLYTDLETGGTLPQHPTIQIAAVAVRDGVEVAHFNQRISFRVEDCDPAALALNHYDPAQWTDAVPGAVAAARFAAWLRPYAEVSKTSKAGNPYSVARLAGYNIVGFDGPRLRMLFGTQFFPCEYLMRDVLQLVIWHFDRVGGARPENYKLATVAAHFGIPTDGAHDALADARMCAAVARVVREAW